MQKELYKIANKTDSKKIAEFLSKDGQLLLPFLEMISNTEQAIDELIDVVGKAAIESVLMLSAQQIAGNNSQARFAMVSAITAASMVLSRLVSVSCVLKSPVFVKKAKAAARKFQSLPMNL